MSDTMIRSNGTDLRKDVRLKGIGLSESYLSNMEGLMNDYLSNIQVFYMNLRGYHWNIRGEQFFTLHEKFEELYDEINQMADEIAERILMLDGKPLHTYSEYIKSAQVPERKNLYTAEDTVGAVIEDLSVIIAQERKLIEVAADAADEGTVDMLSAYVGSQEKHLWMMKAFLK